MELTATRPSGTVRPTYRGIFDVIRDSCMSRAAAGTFVDLPGIVGVRSGSAPLLWVTPEAAPARLTNLVGLSGDVHEMYVDIRNDACVEALGRRGWRAREAMAHMATTAPGIVLTELPPQHAVRSASAQDVPAVRELIGSAFDIPREARYAAYPDDFLVQAAPVQLLVAESGNHIVGSVAVRHQGDAAMMFALAVAETSRRQGLSRGLINRGVSAAINGGAGLVHALTSGVTTGLAYDMGWVQVANWVHLTRGA
jgi:N-acetylglutamate synthase-like GNAT family acetyltransferase